MVIFFSNKMRREKLQSSIWEKGEEFTHIARWIRATARLAPQTVVLYESDDSSPHPNSSPNWEVVALIP